MPVDIKKVSSQWLKSRSGVSVIHKINTGLINIRPPSSSKRSI